MANNRMYLVHLPSKTGVFLGKRMAGGWYGAPEDLPARLDELFAVAGESDQQDHFCLMFESVGRVPVFDINTLPEAKALPSGITLIPKRSAQ